MTNTCKNTYETEVLETVYTYNEWLKEYKRRTYRSRSERAYFLKQKICGLVLAAIGIIVPIVCDGDVTASLLLVPMGLFVLFTKEKVMLF